MKTTTMKTDAQLRTICENLLQRSYGYEAKELTFDEFQRLYSIMIEMRDGQVPVLSVVNLESEIFAQFSDVAPQHFLIKCPRSISRKSFGFVSNLLWHGTENMPESFGSFLIQEVKQNAKKILPILIVFAVLLFFANSDNLYELMTSLLITSSTVFLTIYLIFTVAQSQALQKDRQLFEQGVLQKYYRDDRNVTLLAILTIALIFLNSTLLAIASQGIASSNLWYMQLSLRGGKAISTALVITLLFHSFFTVADYYLQRTRDVTERDLVATIMHEDFSRASEGKDIPQ